VVAGEPPRRAARPPVSPPRLRGMPSSSSSFYVTLGVAPDASADDIRRAYKRLALQLHPDKNLGPAQQGASADFAHVNEAYEVLSAPRRREIYDAFGLEGLRLYEGAYELARASRATGTVLPPLMLVSTLAAATTVIALLLAAFIALAALRFDDALGEAPWPLLFVPLWLADPLLLLVVALVVAEAPPRVHWCWCLSGPASPVPRTLGPRPPGHGET